MPFLGSIVHSSTSSLTGRLCSACVSRYVGEDSAKNWFPCCCDPLNAEGGSGGDDANDK